MRSFVALMDSMFAFDYLAINTFFSNWTSLKWKFEWNNNFLLSTLLHGWCDADSKLDEQISIPTTRSFFKEDGGQSTKNFKRVSFRFDFFLFKIGHFWI